MNKELIVPFDKNAQGLVLIVMPLLAIIFFLLFCLSLFFHHVLPFYMMIIVYCMLLGVAVSLLIIFALVLLQVSSGQPAAILNQEGIWIKYHGFIPWDNIEKIDISQSSPTSPEFLGIRFKNASFVSAQAELPGKYGLFLAKTFSYPYHAYLGNIALKYDQVIDFSQQCMNQESSL